MLRTFIEDESGATAIEYGLIAALIAVAIIAALQGLSGALEENFSEIEDALDSAITTPPAP